MVGAVIGGALSAAGGIGSSLLGGKKSSGGSAQSQYLQALEMNQNIANTAPFIGAGQYAANALQGGLQSGQFGTPMDLSGMPTAGQVPTAPGPFVWNPTMEGLAATPGYQFTLQQAQQAQQSSAAARGLGMSGAAMRGAADYAGGLASKTYDQQLQNAISIYGQGLTRFDKQLAGYNAGAAQFQNQFSDYWANQNNKFSNFYDLARLGANSAAQQGTTGTTAAQNIGNAAQMGANQQAAGIQGAGNALSTFANSPGVQSALTSLFGSNQTGTNLPGTPSYDPNLTVGGYRAPDNSWL